jgi:Uma2 family endonuclease
MVYENEYKKVNPLLIKETGWTVEDYYQLPEDGNQYEIIGGRLELKPSPAATHQIISSNVVSAFLDSCKEEYIILYAPMDVILSDSETRQPDILMIHRSRRHIIEERGIMGPPDLVVEIISPNSAKRDRSMKRESYARFLVPEYWIVDPVYRTIEQYELMREGEPYILSNVYGEEEKVRSQRVKCAGFAVRDVMNN